jgi:lipopolysaccharide export LptBFGC system permease protein LptF
MSDQLADLRTAKLSAPKGKERDEAKAALEAFIESKEASAKACIADGAALEKWSKEDFSSRKNGAQANREARKTAYVPLYSQLSLPLTTATFAALSTSFSVSVSTSKSTFSSSSLLS